MEAESKGQKDRSGHVGVLQPNRLILVYIQRTAEGH